MKKFYKFYKNSGIFNTSTEVLNKLGIFDYFLIFYFYKTPIIKITDKVKPCKNIVTKIVTTIDDIELLVSIQDKRNSFIARLNQGCFAVVIFYMNSPVGYVWGQTVSPHIEGRYKVEIIINPEDVYDFDSYIDVNYRGLGLRKFLIDAFVRHSLKIGKKNITAIIERSNMYSSLVHEKFGYERTNLQLCFRIFSRNFKFILKTYR